MSEMSFEVNSVYQGERDTDFHERHCEEYQFTRMVEMLLVAISEDLTANSVESIEFARLLKAFTSMFRMTEMEISAWYSCLQEVIPASGDFEQLASLTWLSAYHTKSTLVSNMDEFIDVLQREDPEFSKHSADWFLCCPQFSTLTMRKINESYVRLVSLCKKAVQRKSTSAAIDYLFLDETQLTETNVGRKRLGNRGDLTPERLNFPANIKSFCVGFEKYTEIAECGDVDEDANMLL